MITKLMIASTDDILAFRTATDLRVPSNEVFVVKGTEQLPPNDIYLILASSDINNEFGILQDKLIKLPNVRYIQYANIQNFKAEIKNSINAWSKSREWGMHYTSYDRCEMLKTILNDSWFDARIEYKLGGLGEMGTEKIYPRNSYSCGILHMMRA